MFACIVIFSHAWGSMTSRSPVALMAPSMSRWVTLNVGLAALCDQRHVFCIGGAFRTPLSHSDQIRRGMRGSGGAGSCSCSPGSQPEDSLPPPGKKLYSITGGDHQSACQ